MQWFKFPRLRLLRDVASHLWASGVHRAAVEHLELEEGEHLIDVGAGLGPVSIFASEKVGPSGSVTAIEPSRLMRAAINVRRLVNRARRTISVAGGAAEDIRLDDNTVDAAVALNVVHLIEGKQAAANELARVLKPDGRILFVEEDMEHRGHRFHEDSEHQNPDHQRSGHGKLHSDLGGGLDDMAAALTGAGFTCTTSHVEVFGGQPAYLIAAVRRSVA